MRECVWVETERGAGLLTKLEAFVDSVDRKLGGSVGAHARMHGEASCGGNRNDGPHAAEMLDEIVNHQIWTLDIGFLQDIVSWQRSTKSVKSRRGVNTHEVLPPEGGFDFSHQSSIHGPGGIDQDVHLVEMSPEVLI